MSSRDDILASIRKNLPRVDRPLPVVPLFDDSPPAPLLAAFKDNLHRMGGVFLDPPASGVPLAPVRAKIADAKIVCSTVPEIAGNRDIAGVSTPQDLADVDFAIVRASFAVAETGSVLLSDADLHINAVAYLAQHLIVLLDPADIVINLHHAYRRPEFRDRHYGAFHTGPSATADIEGVLIHGAQGVRSLLVLPIARAEKSKSPIEERPMSASNTGTSKRGIDLLHDPKINKSTGFTEAERQALGLVGLVPDVTESIETQLSRVLLQVKSKPNDLERFIHLMNLLETNETLFYRTLMSDPARFLEIVYDPTIGEASLKFDHILRRPHGMYLSISRKGHVKEVLRNWLVKDVRFICATNGGRILGLGDLGANGMAIPIGKLQLYTAAAGVPPEGLLPMYLDAGTNNETYLCDPLYLGLRQHRPPTEELYAFVDEFVEAVQEVFPNCCIHFEDWTGTDAIALLARYRDKVSCYNDDIQGTGGVTLAGLINSLKITGGQIEEQRILFLGAGSAAIGLADLIVSAQVQQDVAPEVARLRIRMFDTQGLVVAGRPGLAAHKLPYAHKLPPSKPFNHLDLASEWPQIVAAVEDFKPTALIGVSTVGKLFSREVVEAMSRLNERPIIFALSNPIEKHECLPEQAYTWSGGKAVYAGGVQFPPVHLAGQTFLPSQANNLYIFPAVGMAIYATNAKRVTDEMFIEAAQAVADQVTPEQLKLGMLFPPQSNILEVEVQTAARVAKLVFDAGLARVDRPANMETFIRRHLYKPEYQTLA